MKPRFIHVAVLGMILAASRMAAAESTNSAAASAVTAAAPAVQAVPAAQPTNAVTSLDFPSFQVISQHNIFDPNRRPRRPTDTRPRVKPTQVDTFSLRGTMSYENKSVAFFDGSSSQYSKAVTLADTIAGYKIAEIAFDHVKLATTSNQVVNLPVGSQMRRQDDGPWSVMENAEPAAESSEPARSESASSDKPADTKSAISGSMSDAVKRLMQKRQQEK